MNRKDLTGMKFGRLTVLEYYDTTRHGVRWECRCDCGATTIAYTSSLTTGNTSSCGCFYKERIKTINIKHGMRHTKIYSTWCNIKKRCKDVSSKRSKDYGGRGISVCKEWNNDFISFYKWAMDNGYSDDLTIERINNNGNYEPSNCKWATAKEQNDNKRNNIFVSINGVVVSFRDFLEAFGVKYKTGYNRYYNGHFPIPENKLGNAIATYVADTEKK